MKKLFVLIPYFNTWSEMTDIKWLINIKPLRALFLSSYLIYIVVLRCNLWYNSLSSIAGEV